MAFSLRSNGSTFERVHRRQWQDRWHASYDAAIHATGREAPSVSQATILMPAKVGMREFHTLSHSETWLALLALYHPAVWEIHEQRILYPTPRPHYLDTHPRGSNAQWKSFAGIIDVADRLGFLKMIRHIRLQDGQDPLNFLTVPVFWIGDLLLFLEDNQGPYLLNWSIKKTMSAFGQPGPRQDGKMDTARRSERAQARQDVEKVYYADADIPTIEIAGDQIDFELRCNLRDLFLDHGTELKIDTEKRARAVEIYSSAIGSGQPANQLVRSVSARLRMSPDDARTVLRQGIWRREIRIDLFDAFHMDKALRPEREDALQRYAAWFRRPK